MSRNMNDRVPVRGTVSRATADAMRRGEIESNNGLRKSYGRRSWNPEQPEFELDDGPTFGQKVMQAFKQAGSDALWSFVVEDLIPAGRYLFRTEVVPVIKRKLHELANDQRKSTQIIDVEAKDIAPAIEEPVAVVPLSDNIIDLAGYRKAVNR